MQKQETVRKAEVIPIPVEAPEIMLHTFGNLKLLLLPAASIAPPNYMPCFVVATLPFQRNLTRWLSVVYEIKLSKSGKIV